jgi:hypothetical protein
MRGFFLIGSLRASLALLVADKPVRLAARVSYGSLLSAFAAHEPRRRWVVKGDSRIT